MRLVASATAFSTSSVTVTRPGSGADMLPLASTVPPSQSMRPSQYAWPKRTMGTLGAKLTLAKGLAMGLKFKMGSEILRTVIVRDWHEIGTVAGIIALRAALTFLIHWEFKEEEKEKEIR